MGQKNCWWSEANCSSSRLASVSKLFRQNGEKNLEDLLEVFIFSIYIIFPDYKMHAFFLVTGLNEEPEVVW